MEKLQPENDLVEQLPASVKSSFLSKLSKKQKISLAALAFFVAIIPLGTSAALLTTRLNSRAYLPATPPTPPTTITITPSPSPTPSATPSMCKNPITSFKVQRSCRLPITKDQENNPANKNKIGYMYANITCQNGYKQLYKSQTCLSEEKLKSIAEQICQKKAVCPSPTISNRPPIIHTTSLPTAITNRNYSASIIVSDQDPKDILSVTTSPPPKNLKILCKKTNLNNKVECLISGTPKKIGIYNIDIKAKDNKGAVTVRTLKLIIQNRPRTPKN